MPQISCKKCKKSAYKKPFYLKKGQGKYCSNKCHYADIMQGRKFSCEVCGKEIYRSLSSINRAKNKKFFCTKSCQTKWRNIKFSGKHHANWKGGRFSYRTIMKRNKVEQVCALCRIADIRVLAVHHIDCNHSNNKYNNLAWLCHNCHYLVHHDNKSRIRLMAVLV